ncbi:Putative aminopeptidase YsdC [Paraconexibacter sp. AEG42_29]|uniref:Aminopeptidase YsdC n=1 Tax=Paraconexibacter sp. AEG42_29 TaxID=2997339 RepID=A0AAU7APS9_9ACTN
MSLPSVLQDLLLAHGPSGHETAPAKVWRDAAAAFAEVEVDHMGNSTARVAGTAGGPTVAIVGHVDEIGLIVTHIDDKGFVYFESVGGWDPQILVGQRVALHTKDAVVPGVVGKKPIHLLEAEERKKVTELKDMHIDIGAADGDEAKGLVRIGDTAVIDAVPQSLLGGLTAARAMDNRLGAFVAFEVARLVAEAGGAPGDVIAVAAVQEEIGLFGAAASSYRIKPDAAIAVDVTFATDTPGSDHKKLGEHPLGSGPVLTRGATLNPRLFEALYDAGNTAEIAFTVSASGGRTGTDADSMHHMRGGIPTTVVSIPLRYMHSPVEVMNVQDVLDTAKLIAATLQTLNAETSFAR